MLRLSKSERIELWLGRLNRFAGSHQSVAEFCSGESISVGSFYQWKQRLAPAVIVPKQARKPKINPKPLNDSAFTELKIPVATPAMASVRLPHGVTIELGSDPSTVAAIVEQVLTHSLTATHRLNDNQHTGTPRGEVSPC